MQIKIKELTHIFNKKTPLVFKALDNVSANIEQGEYVGIIGQTGSGKTTFIEHLNALLLPDGGTIEWVFSNTKYDKKSKSDVSFIDNIIVHSKTKTRQIKKAKQLRKRVGVVFQFAEYQLFKDKICDDIAFGPISFGMSKEEAYKKAEQYLELVGLTKEYMNRSPFELSGGQKRRVAIAGILAMEPDFLVVDEPTAGLDPVGVKEILDIFTRLNKQGKTIINVSHDMDNILNHSKRCLLFKSGKIVRDGYTYDVLRDTKFLLENDMQPPKLFQFIDKLEENGFKIPKVRNIDQLAEYLNGGNDE
ncbi:energy-coupling factor transporter ATPase [Mycoplasmopsis anatis]|uniref:Energy-coupling factor transporter ATP-binding protein EcfA2 n=1 Tax=Mycoplasmopsis anatis TaxID=171279 RepID=A0A9Q3LAS9_9BACT|nr:energy-coupling factor transporter ATPase [Mycoplasmopsis anatis]MBW0594846.1 energy-coupling factor transporter ATPase [Mycoplasmopsis anatis]MBW0595627.1 energy-coupling factor transporter ATPase [Mycoplasmopsis anatis]MBW0596184.1 energy-coupling factor transporter ATPase [Mycoplasmopsis anatis]MBW0596862.1 energy-coupling factor transporter ATPase [Mycoplasmopsis anatis]MBW0597618.1 energy-coupling factor transporter ATPase [Mycoplasmopsis anatis]